MKKAVFFLLANLLLSLVILGLKGKTMIGVEKTGMWYPANSTLLKKQIKDFIKASNTDPKDNIMALIAPHAGYIYSGENAAYSYAQINGKNFDRIIVLGPSHYYHLNNQIALPDSDEYKTVLGTIPLDTKVIDQLSKSSLFTKDNAPFSKEHSTDNQIPFLQETARNFKLIPMIMGQFSADKIIEVANILKKVIDHKTLIVISSDFTHYGSNFGFTPFKNDIAKNLKNLNENSVLPIKNLDAKAFAKHIEKTQDTICGAMPITLLLHLLPVNTKTNVLKYSTSADKTGDTETVVSYFSLSFEGTWDTDKEATMNFTENEKKDLLKLSRLILDTVIKTKKVPSEKDAQITITETMKHPAGGFVTLHMGKELRGCIGEINPTRSVLEVVKNRTISAATQDPRFSPVEPSELNKIKIEISILTPPQKINSYEEFEVGKHGIILEKNGRSAVFLPQVAPEQGWDRPTTLNYLAQKAGLPMDAWKEKTNFSVFEAIVFSEK